MGLISRVSSRTYRKFKLTIPVNKNLSFSSSTSSEKHLPSTHPPHSIKNTRSGTLPIKLLTCVACLVLSFVFLSLSSSGRYICLSSPFSMLTVGKRAYRQLFRSVNVLGALSFTSSNAHSNPKRDFQFYSAMPQQQPIVLDSKDPAKPSAVCIFLHGLGDTGDGWAWGFKDPKVRNPEVKYIFPTAKTIPVSLNGGFAMTAWFDIYGLSPGDKEDEKGIKSAKKEIETMINEQLSLHPHLTHKNIILGGFSLGGALAMYTTLFQTDTDSSFGGLIALSTWLPLRDQFLNDKSFLVKQRLNGLKVFQGHGDADPVVPFQFGALTSKIMAEQNLDLKFKSYSGMAHSSCEDEMNDVKAFIQSFVK